MTMFSQIVPGKTINRGVNDLSIPDYDVAPVSYPLHLPMIQVVTPRGPISDETQWIRVEDFASIYGDIFNHRTPYYSPVSLLVQQFARGGQSAIGVRRLCANNKVARVPISAFIQKLEVKDFKRDPYGQFELDKDTGERIEIGSFENGLSVTIRPDYELLKGEVGAGKMRTIKAAVQGQPDTYVYPLFELLAGVGEEYNNNGVVLGSKNGAMDWRTTSSFVQANGVFPFNMRQFIDNPVDSTRRFVKTKASQDTVQFTLFPVEDQASGIQYGLKEAINEYTGGNVNRPITLRPAPFGDIYVYQDMIEGLAQMMYVTEKENNANLLNTGAFSYRQMNPFGCVDHTGVPYFAITSDDTIQWDMVASVKAKGGLNPFHGDDGKLHPAARQVQMDDPFGLLAAVDLPTTIAQGWDILNALAKVDIENYLDSNEVSNVAVNRVSMMYDVGFQQSLKDALVKVITRKDLYLMSDALIWDPGVPNEVAAVYSRLGRMNSQIRNIVESAYWGTPAMRSSINMIEAKVIDEPTGMYFSGNLDLAYVYSRFGGGAAGLLSVSNSPDHGVNRELQTMHSPITKFEDDDNSARNFDLGGVTVRPYDVSRLFRPALPTVYSVSPDSVLKDQVSGFLCVCVEKIGQDEWNVVCGDTTLTADNYAAIVKDNIERKVRDQLGGLIRKVNVNCTYNEKVRGGRAVMNTVIEVYFNKGKYMMTMDLFAYNEQDIASN